MPVETTERTGAERSLGEILQLAYSGELAAAYAYRGHWRSSTDPGERARIREIEEEEWHHRRLVGGMLQTLGLAPSRLRELRAASIGRVLGVLCHVAGRLAPLYGAGRLESRNIHEYEAAARYAVACGRDEWLDCLITMAEVEWDHEQYFRGLVETHWLGRRLALWPRPAPRESIRAAFPTDSDVRPDVQTGLRLVASARG